MLKLQIFANFLAAVAEETGVEASVIASGDRSAEAVDARYLLVYFLSRRGFYASMIAPLIGHNKRSVNHILSGFEDRMKMLAAMDEVPFGRGIIRGTIGKGVIRIEVPDGPVWGLLFGNTGAIKLTADDFNALRNIVSSRLQ